MRKWFALGRIAVFASDKPPDLHENVVKVAKPYVDVALGISSGSSSTISRSPRAYGFKTSVTRILRFPYRYEFTNGMHSF